VDAFNRRLSRDELIAGVRAAAAASGIDGALICAMAEQESAWNPWAIRYEPQFYKRYVTGLIAAERLSETESRARATSWGLLQVMGQVAREHGFSGAFLAELCDPASGVQIGCKVFAGMLEAEKTNVTEALQRWNGGDRPEYAAEVLARVQTYR
jgi:soluble lytic murein transglycosylase-like protein